MVSIGLQYVFYGCYVLISETTTAASAAVAAAAETRTKIAKANEE